MYRLLVRIIRWGVFLCVPGGVLWALAPLGVYLSEYRFGSPDVFWRMFPSAVLLLMFGLAGLQARSLDRPGWLKWAGFSAALLGCLLIVAGDVGKFWIGLDDIYLITAPAYRVMRLGLFVFAAGSILFGIFALQARWPSSWGVLPFLVGAAVGLVAVSWNLGTLGMVMWIMFGAGWAWLGLTVLVEEVGFFLRNRRGVKGGTSHNSL